jgi:hypothetical protein
VNKRRISWLLAALMTLCASQAVPVVRAERVGVTCAIVWMARVRTRAEQRMVIREPQVYGLRRSNVCQPVEPRLSSRIFADSLYQRPPPLVLL